MTIILRKQSIVFRDEFVALALGNPDCVNALFSRYIREIWVVAELMPAKLFLDEASNFRSLFSDVSRLVYSMGRKLCVTESLPLAHAGVHERCIRN